LTRFGRSTFKSSIFFCFLTTTDLRHEVGLGIFRCEYSSLQL